MIIWKTKEKYELWEAQKNPFEELLRKTKEHARARKLVTDAVRGEAGVTAGPPRNLNNQTGLGRSSDGEDNRRMM